MPTTREFLGWDGPALPRAVAWLRAHRGGGGWDFSNLIVVVPSTQAGRRLLELLVEAAEGEQAALAPPRIVTPGELPELLYEAPSSVAEPLHVMLAWVHALRGAGAGVMARVVPHPPEAEQWLRWWALAEQMAGLARDLAAHRLRMADVPMVAAERGVDLRGEERWQALAKLDERYHAALRAMGLVDRDRARLEAVEAGRCACAQPLVLLGTVDLNPVVRAMLSQCDDVAALIHAPAEHADGFDASGSLTPAYWSARRLAIIDEMIRFVDRPSDQAAAVVEAIAAVAPAHAADEVTVGLGDEKMAGPIRRTLELAGLPTRYAAGRPMGQSRPALLLGSLGRFVNQRRFDDLAALLRHPDVERYVQRAMGEQAGEAAIAHWLTLLDEYAADHVQGRVDGRWLGDGAAQARLEKLWQSVLALWPIEPDERRPLPQWSEAIAGALTTVFGDLELARYEREDDQLIRALGAVGELLREQAELDVDAATTPVVTGAQAIALTVRRLAEQNLPEDGGDAAIELTGFLELQLDDAPVVVVTSLNEGTVPGSRNADPFLPDSLRSQLGMSDNRRRYARDLLMLEAVVRSRPRVTLIAGRRSAEGEPLAPSRLLLACDDDALVRRVHEFYAEADERTPAPAAPLLLQPGGESRFLIPPPLLDVPPINALPVTAFRAYLACPYRFYLRHVLKLRAQEDGVFEMDALSFGSLAHGVLEAFGRSELTDCADPNKVEAFLSDRLEMAAGRKFGSNQRPAILLQVEQLRERLRIFAQRQAAWVREGWRIVPEAVETKLTAQVMVDGEPFTINGRVDRVDRHPELGYRILDYKTGDTANKPEKTHRRREGDGHVWVDLQLPLYLNLCALKDVAPDKVQLGYVNLPKKLGDVDVSLAKWTADEIADAMEVRDVVVRKLRQQVFWPPGDVPDFDDEFSMLCGDTSLQRDELIRVSQQGGAA